MKKQNKAPDRENLYTLTICYYDAAGMVRWTKWRRCDLDKPSVRTRTEQALKRHFPGFDHANIYGGISQDFKGQIKFEQ